MRLLVLGRTNKRGVAGPQLFIALHDFLLADPLQLHSALCPQWSSEAANKSRLLARLQYIRIELRFFDWMGLLSCSYRGLAASNRGPTPDNKQPPYALDLRSTVLPARRVCAFTFSELCTLLAVGPCVCLTIAVVAMGSDSSVGPAPAAAVLRQIASQIGSLVEEMGLPEVQQALCGRDLVRASSCPRSIHNDDCLPCLCFVSSRPGATPACPSCDRYRKYG